MVSDIKKIREQLFSGELTMVQLVNQYLSNLKACLDLNIYIEIYEKEALQQAADLDERILQKDQSLGDLLGVVASIKDVLCYKNHDVTAGSKILEGFESQFTGTALQRALKEDIIIIGRTNCDEFAMGSSNEHSYYGPTYNGADSDRVPGGSSGAAAVSVQMDTCLVAFGSDTGGSVRQPASFCGVYGFKPTYGRISRYGLIAYASSFDQIGLLSKDIENIALVLKIIEGKDDLDATSAELPNLSMFPKKDQYKFVYFPEILDHPKLSPSIKESLLSKISDLKKDGHIVEATSFDLMDYLVPCYYVLTTAEASSNLNRYDGIRYGHQASEVNDIKELYTKSRSEGFGKEVKRRIVMGTFVLSVGYFDAYFNKAQKVRHMLVDRLNSIFENCDFIIMPTTTDVAWKVGEKIDDPLEVYLSDVFTVLANLCGLPAISIPQCHSSYNGLPFGLQIMAQKFDDVRLLEFSSKT